METWRKVLFVAYAVGSYIYRWVVTFSILYFLSNWLKPYKLGTLSAMLALAALGSMVVWPLYRLFKGLHKRGRIPDMKRKNVSIFSAILAVLLLVFFLVPLPISRVRQTGLVQIEPANVRKLTLSYDAILTALHVRNGERVAEGQLIAEFRSPKLESDLVVARGSYDVAAAEFRATADMLRVAKDEDERKLLESQRVKAAGDMQQAKVEADYLQDQLDRLSERQGLRAPCDGVVLGAPRPEEVGKEWQRDSPTPFCSVGDPKKLIILVPVSPSDYQLLRSDLNQLKELEVDVRIPGRKSQTVPGRIVRLPESDAKDVPLSLTQRGGGPLAVKPAGPDPNVNLPQSQQYLVTVELPQPDDAICPGTMVSVKVHCKWRTAAWKVWHAISSAFDLGLI
jgi:putative peptide zinc metalloprotease protein